MQILLINSLDKNYGSTYRARYLCEIIRRLGHVVTYVESNSEELEGTLSIKQTDRVLSYIGATLARSEFCIFRPYDLAIIQKFSPLTSLPMLLTRLRKKKLIVDWDDLDTEFQPNTLRRGMFSVMEKFLPMMPDAITTHSGHIERHARKMGLKNIHRVDQVVDTDLFDPAATSSKKERTSAESEKKTVGYLCTLTHGGAADLDLVIEHVSLLFKRRDDFRFLLIGGGPLESHSRALIERSPIDDYEITGLLEQKEIPQQLARCEICLVFMRDNPGNRMRVSLKTLEYLSMNRKVVGTLVGETLQRLGHLCTVFDPKMDDFCAIVEEALADRSPRQTRDFIIKHHAIDAVTRQVQGVLEQVCT